MCLIEHFLHYKRSTQVWSKDSFVSHSFITLFTFIITNHMHYNKLNDASMFARRSSYINPTLTGSS